MKKAKEYADEIFKTAMNTDIPNWKIKGEIEKIVRRIIKETEETTNSIR